MTKTVYVIKLVTGEQLATHQYLGTMEDKTISVNKPLLIHLYQDQQGKPAVTFYPFQQTPFAKDQNDSVPVYTKDIMFIGEANDEISQYYNQVTSPIIQPNSGLILPN